MGKIITIQDISGLSKQLKQEGKNIVLVGGCFDILHLGHIVFLQNAKKHGDILMVLLEHDEDIKQQKGKRRPINDQHARAVVLAELTSVDYIILLPSMNSNTMYDDLIYQIKPAIIATTEGDLARGHKERQAKLIGCQVVNVTRRIENRSTTEMARLIENEI